MSPFAIIPILAVATLAQDSKPAGPIVVRLEPMAPASRGTGLRWSPKAGTIALTRQDGGFSGAMTIGPKATPPVSIRLTQSAAAAHVDGLEIDLDRDGKVSAAERFTCVPTDRRGKWWSSFEVPFVIPVPAAAEGASPAVRAFPIAMWFVADPAEPDAQPALRWTRAGWHEGTATIGGKPALVLITEMELDGVFDQRDAWGLARDHAKLMTGSPRRLEEHVWLEGIAYRPTHIDAHGRELRFEAFDPGFTEAAELAKADTLKPDREAPRAAAPVPFGKDFAAALTSAKQARKRVLVDFETTWCGPCKTMNDYVYTAAPVATAAQNVIAVKVDGDDHPDLKKAHNVTGYPTIILLDADGTEIRRVVGYRGVTDMVAFLGP